MDASPPEPSPAVPFRYAPPIVEDFPGIRGGVIHVAGVVNGPTPPDLLDEYLAQQRTTLADLDGIALAEVPSLAAWRRAFSAFGVQPTKYRSAAEALLRRLTKAGDVPSINLLVDLGNLVSIRYRLPVAVCDQRAVTGTTTVRYADGTEPFTDLGSQQIDHPVPGEVIFADDAGLVSARRWCWRQSDQSAAREDTEEIVLVVEGHHDGADADVANAVDDLTGLLDRYQAVTPLSTALLGP